MTPGSREKGNIVPFPKKKRRSEQTADSAKVTTALETESLRDEARRTELAHKAELALDNSRAVDRADAFSLAVNFHDFIYNLQSSNRLKVRDIASKARGDCTPREVRALADYLPPKGVRTWSEFNPKYENRRLATKPARYKDLIVSAAALAGFDRRDAIIALVIGTKFEPRELDVEDEDIQPIREIASVLADIPLALDRIFPTKKYFDLLDRFQAEPTVSKDRIEFELHALASDDRDIKCMPSIPFASRVVRAEEATLVIGEFGDENPDFPAQHDAGKVFSIQVTELEHMALAIARINGTVRPVGLIWTTLQIETPRGINISCTEGSRHLYNDDCYYFIELEIEGKTVAGAWKLKKSVADWRFEEEYLVSGISDDPDYTVRIIDYDYLINDTQEWGYSRLHDDPIGLFKVDRWQYYLWDKNTRVSNKRALAGLFEMALSVDEQYDNVLSALLSKYAQMTDALQLCHKKEFGHIQDALEKARRRLRADGPEFPQSDQS